MDKEYMTNDTYRVMFKDYPDVVTVSCGTWKCCRGLLRRLLSAAIEPVILDIVSDR